MYCPVIPLIWVILETWGHPGCISFVDGRNSAFLNVKVKPVNLYSILFFSKFVSLAHHSAVHRFYWHPLTEKKKINFQQCEIMRCFWITAWRLCVLTMTTGRKRSRERKSNHDREKVTLQYVPLEVISSTAVWEWGPADTTLQEGAGGIISP